MGFNWNQEYAMIVFFPVKDGQKPEEKAVLVNQKSVVNVKKQKITAFCRLYQSLVQE